MGSDPEASRAGWSPSTTFPERVDHGREIELVEIAVGVLAVADAGDDHGHGRFVDRVDDAIVTDPDAAEEWRAAELFGFGRSGSFARLASLASMRLASAFGRDLICASAFGATSTEEVKGYGSP